MIEGFPVYCPYCGKECNGNSYVEASEERRRHIHQNHDKHW